MIVALAGGVGGARLAVGLAAVLPPDELAIVVNTGDDFDHLGFRICPDLDTVMYTLSGLADEQRGWGLAHESFAGLEMLRRYGGPAWFALGDRDVATQLLRAEALRAGASLSAVTAQLCGALGIAHPILPMADGPRKSQILALAERSGISQSRVLVMDASTDTKTLTANIAIEMGYAMGDHQKALFATGVVLFFFIILLNAVALRVAKRKF